MTRLRTGLLAGGVALLAVALPAGARAVASPSAWAVAPSPNTSPSQDDILNGVSCASPTACVAVGYAVAGPGANRTLVETWNGSTWSITPSPDVSSTSDDFLSGVSCAGSSFCVAVGYSFPGPTTLVEMRNAGAWTIVPSPNVAPATPDNALFGVSCASSSACMAVGESYSGGHNHTLVESWNGAAWSIVPSPNTLPKRDNVLNAVSCAAPAACAAVGYHTIVSPTSTLTQTLVETWNGAAWSIVHSDNPRPVGGLRHSPLAAVSCTSPTTCVAAGAAQGNSPISKALVESSTGAGWVIDPTPDSASPELDALAGVSCTGALSCVAVGFHTNAAGLEDTFIETLTGSTWSITPSPNVAGAQDDVLSGVSCPSTSFCVAVGVTIDSAGIDHTLVETT